MSSLLESFRTFIAEPYSLPISVCHPFSNPFDRLALLSMYFGAIRVPAMLLSLGS